MIYNRKKDLSFFHFRENFYTGELFAMKFFKTSLKFFSIAALALAFSLFNPVKAEAATNVKAYAAVFDAQFYASNYPDLYAAFGNNEKALFDHFLNNGMKEGRRGNAAFDPRYYKERYTDLQVAFGDDYTQYYMHYITCGSVEGRVGSDGAVVPVKPVTTATAQTQTPQPQATVTAANYDFNAQADQKADIILAAIGYDLHAAYNWSASLTYYGHGKADMPEVPTPGTGFFADYGFSYGKGNCYVMAATFVKMARRLGYTARQITGYVPLRSGGLTVHSWAEVDIDGVTYVCDPNCTNETGINAYLIQYGQRGTWRYSNYSVMTD